MTAVLEQWWQQNVLTFAVGTIFWLTLGLAAILLVHAPVQRQRLAESTLIAVFVWLGLALLPSSGLVVPGMTASVNEPVADAVFVVSNQAVPATVAVTGATSWTLEQWLGLFFTIGSTLCCLHLVVGNILLRRLLRTAQPVSAPIQEFAASLPLAPRGLRVVTSSATARPFCCGLVRPRVVLPVTLVDTNSHNDLRAVLLHEYGHIQQGDLRGQVLFAIALPLLFWNPMYWWLRREARLAAELVADDLAVRYFDKPTYVRDLIDLAQRLPTARDRVTTLAVFGQHSEFFRRMNMLLRRQDHLSTRCSSLSSAARHSTFLVLAAVASLAWSSVDVGAQQPVPVKEKQAAKSKPSAAAKTQPKTTTVRLRLSVALDKADDLGKAVIGLSSNGYSVVSLDMTTLLRAKLTITSRSKFDLPLLSQHIAPAQLLSVARLSFTETKAKPAIERVVKQELPSHKISIDIKNEDICEVVDTIASQAGINVIVAPEVQGTITMKVVDVEARAVLEAAVQTLGYAVVVDRNLLVITTKSAAAEVRKAR